MRELWIVRRTLTQLTAGEKSFVSESSAVKPQNLGIVRLYARCRGSERRSRRVGAQ